MEAKKTTPFNLPLDKFKEKRTVIMVVVIVVILSATVLRQNFLGALELLEQNKKNTRKSYLANHYRTLGKKASRYIQQNLKLLEIVPKLQVWGKSHNKAISFNSFEKNLWKTKK